MRNAARRPRSPAAWPSARSRRRLPRRVGWLLVASALLLALWGIHFRGWVAPPTPPQPLAEAARAAQSRPEPAVKKESRRPQPNARSSVAIPREMLIRAMQARAADLRACARPPGAAARLLARIRVNQTGAVQGVSFAGAAALPREYRECLKKRIGGWTFVDLRLASSVNVLVEFAL